LSLKIDPVILKELRYQHLVQFKLSLYKRPEFLFLQCLGVNDIFQAFTNEEYGFIGTVRLRYDKEHKAWVEEWYEDMREVVDLAESIQQHKDKTHFAVESKIINAHISYMNRFIKNLDNSIIYS
jgi:hypothetical protein